MKRTKQPKLMRKQRPPSASYQCKQNQHGQCPKLDCVCHCHSATAGD